MKNLTFFVIFILIMASSASVSHAWSSSFLSLGIGGKNGYFSADFVNAAPYYQERRGREVHVVEVQEYRPVVYRQVGRVYYEPDYYPVVVVPSGRIGRGCNHGRGRGGGRRGYYYR